MTLLRERYGGERVAADRTTVSRTLKIVLVLLLVLFLLMETAQGTVGDSANKDPTLPQLTEGTAGAATVHGGTRVEPARTTREGHNGGCDR